MGASRARLVASNVEKKSLNAQIALVGMEIVPTP